MKQFWAVLAVVGLGAMTACGGNSFQSGAPTARLSVPACVVQGTTVVLDASKSTDPEGQLVKFIFSLGQGIPDHVSDTPRLNHTYAKPLVVNGGYLPYQVSVTVVDKDGNYGALQDPRRLYVVRNEADCPALQDDILEADLSGNDTTPPQDTLPPDTQSVDTTPVDTVAVDTVPVDTIPVDTIFEDAAVDTVQPVDTIQPIDTVQPVDTEQPDTIQPVDTVTSCTNIAGKWHVTTRRDGVKQLEMDIDLYQTECNVNTDGNFLTGSIAADGTLSIDSNIGALHMENCKGPAAKPTFSVTCDTDGDGGVWTADFLAK
jgi:hypothetical protein